MNSLKFFVEIYAVFTLLKKEIHLRAELSLNLIFEIQGQSSFSINERLS